MKVSMRRLHTLIVGAAFGAIAMVAIGGGGGTADPAPAAAADAKRQATERKVQRTRDGRFAYVTATFAIPPGASGAGEAACPTRGHLTGAFGGGSALVGSDDVILPATILGRDAPNDRDKITDDGARAFIENTTAVEASGRVEAICQLAKKKRRR
jgi:hypothetical protein